MYTSFIKKKTEAMKEKHTKGDVFIVGTLGKVELIKPEVYIEQGIQHCFGRWKVKLLDHPERHTGGVCYVWPREFKEVQ
jgi:hypothetical protein